MIKKAIGLFFVAITVAIVSANVYGQTAPETLTNAKILEMLRSGLSEALIVAKINKSECQCDTSTAAITKLKSAKVSDAIIMAMMDAQGGGYSESPTAKPGASTPVKAVDETPDAGPKQLREIAEPGIYLFEDGKMTAIEPTVFSGSSMNTWKSSMTLGIKKAKYKAKVMGASANTQVANPLPVFYFVFSMEYKKSGAVMAGFYGLGATSPNEFILVQMDMQKNSRQAVLGEYGTFSGMDMGARDKDVRGHSFEKIRPGVYKVTPKQPLTPGQYSFYYAANVTGLGFAGGKVFDFGVR